MNAVKNILQLLLCIRCLSTASLCQISDGNLLRLKETIVCSLGGDPNCDKLERPAQGDWPNQAIYMHNLLAALVDKKTCLDTEVAQDTVAWLDITDEDKSMWWWTWNVFQPQYYEMPRKEGDRIESPATLGRKCWAFAYLAQIWPSVKPQLQIAMNTAALDLYDFIQAYDDSVPMSMSLCPQVLANCFVNATYDPDLRNGTCPGPVDEFYVGFEWENGNNNVQYRNDGVIYPFPTYNQTEKFQSDVQFAVNTALNYII